MFRMVPFAFSVEKSMPAVLVALVTNYSYTWWTHFEPVEGCTYLKDLSESLGDFRVAKCLHCDMLVRRGKPGCTARETTNAGMASHMRTKHSALALQVMLFFVFCCCCNLYCHQWLKSHERCLQVFVVSPYFGCRGSLLGLYYI